MKKGAFDCTYHLARYVLRAHTSKGGKTIAVYVRLLLLCEEERVWKREDRKKLPLGGHCIFYQGPVFGKKAKKCPKFVSNQHPYYSKGIYSTRRRTFQTLLRVTGQRTVLYV